uniref:phosphoethanolamine N-methyltransferase n=1 Tax=Oncorhynchus mykiss TaxID=8022 RepID=A0A8C7TCC4_ONCMY
SDHHTLWSTMTEFWKEHSRQATVEEMMLDSHAQELTLHELPEILSLLPSLSGQRVLELGAGIGRYTSHLLTQASHVTAVDFMESFVEKNRQDNSHHGNASFLQADVTKLDFPKNSFDIIFSNWLLMYLSDEELTSLTERMLGWLCPGGYLFFRESCNYQSGDCKRTFNPTHYRSSAHYSHLMTTTLREESEGAEKQVFGFDIVLNKTVQTYIKMKNNQNQVCWLLEKVGRDTACQEGFRTFQQFLDNQQYTRKGILRYEKMFGAGYVSTGGHSTTKEFVNLLNLKPGMKVLDVGCGIGGGNFYMAKAFGVEVLGLDLSANMVDIAIERSMEEKLPSVHFEVADATKREFPEASFDVVYSRDTILHIDDKLAMFKRFHSWLKPGGQVLITDYCCGEKPWTPPFQEYVKQRGYILYTPPQYGKFLQQAGFSNVRAEDRTTQFMQVIQTELERAGAMEDEFIKEFSEEDYLAIVNGWRDKLKRCKSGDQRWGLFHATRN